MSVSVPVVREATSAIRKFFGLDLLDNRYPALHGMRVLAIATVVQFHVTLISLQDGIPIDSRWAERSLNIFFGMDLFFVLSGFLIGSILLRSIEVSGSQQVRRFYLRRAFRTFPSYYLTLTWLYLDRSWSHHLSPAQRHHILFEYAYLTDYGSPRLPDNLIMPWGWSLAVEEKFYLTVPLLFFLLRKLRSDRSRLAVLGAMWASALAVRLAIFFSRTGWTEDTLSDTLYFSSHTRYDTLIAGVMLAYAQRRWREPITRWLESRVARATLVAVVIACLVLLIDPDMFGDDRELLVRVVLWGSVTTIMYFALVILIINRQSDWIPRFLSAPTFRKLATLGYGVYLAHIPLCWWIAVPLAHWLHERQGWSMATVWPFSVVLLLLLSFWWAYCLHVWVEKPFLRLRDRVAG